VIIVSIQQVFSLFPELFPSQYQESIANVWYFIYPTPIVKPGASILPGFALPEVAGISILYVILPWLAVMMAGYGFGKIVMLGRDAIRRICLRIGLGAILVFLVAATIDVLTTTETTGSPFIFRLLGQHKYPPSQLFLLMTLGPVIALVPWAERVGGWFANAFRTVGRVPMFYYLLHLLVIHLSALLINLWQSGTFHQEWYRTAPLVLIPDNQRWGLPLLYAVWIVDVVILYFACRWYARYKSNHPEKTWIKYV